MRSTAHTAQVISPFGRDCVQEHRGETHRYLARAELAASVVKINEAVSTMTGAMFEDLMKSLRGALSLRQTA
jgi:hypothetical protein